MLNLLAAESSNDLIKVVPGLMIWTLIAFAITFFVLRKYAFGPIQKMIDERRERIRSSIEEAEHARAEARDLAVAVHVAPVGSRCLCHEGRSMLLRCNKSVRRCIALARGEKHVPIAFLTCQLCTKMIPQSQEPGPVACSAHNADQGLKFAGIGGARSAEIVTAAPELADYCLVDVVAAKGPAETRLVLTQGGRIGLIRFGSRTDVFVPLSARPVVKVKAGDRVRVGGTVLAEYA